MLPASLVFRIKPKPPTAKPVRPSGANQMSSNGAGQTSAVADCPTVRWISASLSSEPLAESRSSVNTARPSSTRVHEAPPSGDLRATASCPTAHATPELAKRTVVRSVETGLPTWRHDTPPSSDSRIKPRGPTAMVRPPWLATPLTIARCAATRARDGASIRSRWAAPCAAITHGTGSSTHTPTSAAQAQRNRRKGCRKVMARGSDRGSSCTRFSEPIHATRWLQDSSRARCARTEAPCSLPPSHR